MLACKSIVKTMSEWSVLQQGSKDELGPDDRIVDNKMAMGEQLS